MQAINKLYDQNITRKHLLKNISGKQKKIFERFRVLNQKAWLFKEVQKYVDESKAKKPPKFRKHTRKLSFERIFEQGLALDDVMEQRKKKIHSISVKRSKKKKSVSVHTSKKS
jgi:hypothetical protein